MKRVRIAICATILLPGLTAAAQSTHQGSMLDRDQPAQPVLSGPSCALPQTIHSSGKVIFQDGMLSITAQDDRLGDILNEVAAQTGATIELPPGAAETRVTAELGPGDPIKMIGRLLYGMHFNYIVLGSTDKVCNLTRIVVSSRRVAAEPAAPSAPPPAVAPPETAQQPEQANASTSATTDDADKDKEKNKDDKDKAQAQDQDKDKDQTQAQDNQKADQKDDKAASKNTDAAGTDDKSEQKAASDSQSDNAQSGSGDSDKEQMQKRLANLPPSIDPRIAQLYPSLFGGGDSIGAGEGNRGNGTISGTQPIGQPVNNPLPTSALAHLPVGANGVPVLPSNIPPEIWNLYPPNLLEMVHSASAPPLLPSGPLAPNIPAPAPGQGLMWDQSIKGH